MQLRGDPAPLTIKVNRLECVRTMLKSLSILLALALPLSAGAAEPEGQLINRVVAIVDNGTVTSL